MSSAYALETAHYGGLDKAHAILETAIPDDLALVVNQGTLAAADMAEEHGAILDMPFERAPALAAGWTPPVKAPSTGTT